jgi:hypothetical protein
MAILAGVDLLLRPGQIIGSRSRQSQARPVPPEHPDRVLGTRFWSGRGHPLSGTRETWMAPMSLDLRPCECGGFPAIRPCLTHGRVRYNMDHALDLILERHGRLQDRQRADRVNLRPRRRCTSCPRKSSKKKALPTLFSGERLNRDSNRSTRRRGTRTAAPASNVSGPACRFRFQQQSWTSLPPSCRRFL